MTTLECFEFRIIEAGDGTEIIDRTLKTPYNSLTPTQMLNYIEWDNQIAFMERLKRSKRRENAKSTRSLVRRLVAACMTFLWEVEL